MWFVVELLTLADHGYGGEVYEYNEVGEVFGPFPNEAAAKSYVEQRDRAAWHNTYEAREASPVSLEV